MLTIVEIAIGLVAGIGIVLGCIYLALRPDRRPEPDASWMARPSRQPDGTLENPNIGD